MRAIRVPRDGTLTAQRRARREEVANAQMSLQSFIELLGRIPCREGAYTLSMDLYTVFAQFYGIDLPIGFQVEFGRQINKACCAGRLPFHRKTVTKASIAAWAGLEKSDLLMMLIGEERCE